MPGYLKEGEQAYLSIKIGLGSIDPSCDDLLYDKGWQVGFDVVTILQGIELLNLLSPVSGLQPF